MEFRNRAKDLREDHDLTQTQLARIFHTTQRKISRMETGENEPNLHDILLYCKYFKVSADYLLGLTDIPKMLQKDGKYY